LNLRLVSSVYFVVVFWMLECPSHSCSARVSWPGLAPWEWRVR
jgi:hypothetical protein